jgi:RNA polymerase sigma factor (TIGR02999 family)
VEQITQILVRVAEGDAKASNDLMSLVYEELRRIASSKMASESADHSLQATALVHEAWLRLGGDDQPTWESRRHFFFAAAQAMRRILIDRARRRAAERHGGGLRRIDLEDVEIARGEVSDQVLAVDEALERLALEDPKKAELVRLRYFTGMQLKDAAQVLGISMATATRSWAYSRAWLTREMRAGQK